MAVPICRSRMRDEATASLKHVVALRPNELQTRVALFSLALESNDDVAMKEAQDQLLRVVGSKEDSNWLYSEARRLLSLSPRESRQRISRRCPTTHGSGDERPAEPV